jgi:flavin reductase (DIM6/NTAB) family NADH-FMN oxidoreductase RutF
MRILPKADFPLIETRRLLEPGPVVLLSSAHRGERNIMTMGWHMMLGFSPALVACYIWPGNRSHELVKRSRECVINIPTRALLDQVVGIGNSTGADVDKFAQFDLTPQSAVEVAAPLIGECFANLECRLADASQINRYDLFIWQVVKAHVAIEPASPQTLHYLGQGEFMVAGKVVNCRRRFKAQNL